MTMSVKKAEKKAVANCILDTMSWALFTDDDDDDDDDDGDISWTTSSMMELVVVVWMRPGLDFTC